MADSGGTSTGVVGGFPAGTILGRPLTAEERRLSQRGYRRFCFVNGASYMCLGENVLILFAANLEAPNAVVSLLGAMLFVGYAMLPFGVRETARKGAARSLADFWVARNAAALLTASATLVASFSAKASWAVLLVGSLLFYGCRAAGSVMGTPLVGDISSRDEAPETFGRSQALFNASAVVTLAAITVVTAHWHGTIILAGIIVLGSCLGVTASHFLRGISETGDVMLAARRPLLPGIKAVARNPDVRRLAVAWTLLNLSTILLLPMSMLALKRGCGFGDSEALVCACAQFGAGAFASWASGPLCRRFGARAILVAIAAGYMAVPLIWLTIPPGGVAGIAAGVALFLWLGGLYTVMQNATPSYFLVACPNKAEQVAGSVGINLATGVGAGLLGSLLGSWFVSAAERWARSCASSTASYELWFAGGIGVFRLYFLLLMPLLATTLLAAMRLRAKTYVTAK